MADNELTDDQLLDVGDEDVVELGDVGDEILDWEDYEDYEEHESSQVEGEVDVSLGNTGHDTFDDVDVSQETVHAQEEDAVDELGHDDPGGHADTADAGGELGADGTGEGEAYEVVGEVQEEEDEEEEDDDNSGTRDRFASERTNLPRAPSSSVPRLLDSSLNEIAAVSGGNKPHVQTSQYGPTQYGPTAHTQQQRQRGQGNRGHPMQQGMQVQMAGGRGGMAGGRMGPRGMGPGGMGPGGRGGLLMTPRGPGPLMQQGAPFMRPASAPGTAYRQVLAQHHLRQQQQPMSAQGGGVIQVMTSRSGHVQPLLRPRPAPQQMLQPRGAGMSSTSRQPAPAGNVQPLLPGNQGHQQQQQQRFHGNNQQMRPSGQQCIQQQLHGQQPFRAGQNQPRMMQPNQPGIRPGQPTLKSGQQTLRPGQQRLRPAQPGQRPGQQLLRPNQQGLRPNQQIVRPNQQTPGPNQQNLRPNQQTIRPNQQGFYSQPIQTSMNQPMPQGRNQQPGMQTNNQRIIQTSNQAMNQPLGPHHGNQQRPPFHGQPGPGWMPMRHVSPQQDMGRPRVVIAGEQTPRPIMPHMQGQFQQQIPPESTHMQHGYQAPNQPPHQFRPQGPGQYQPQGGPQQMGPNQPQFPGQQPLLQLDRIVIPSSSHMMIPSSGASQMLSPSSGGSQMPMHGSVPRQTGFGQNLGPMPGQMPQQQPEFSPSSQRQVVLSRNDLPMGGNQFHQDTAFGQPIFGSQYQGPNSNPQQEFPPQQQHNHGPYGAQHPLQNMGGPNFEPQVPQQQGFPPQHQLMGSSPPPQQEMAQQPKRTLYINPKFKGPISLKPVREQTLEETFGFPVSSAAVAGTMVTISRQDGGQEAEVDFVNSSFNDSQEEEYLPPSQEVYASAQFTPAENQYSYHATPAASGIRRQVSQRPFNKASRLSSNPAVRAAQRAKQRAIALVHDNRQQRAGGGHSTSVRSRLGPEPKTHNPNAGGDASTSTVTKATTAEMSEEDRKKAARAQRFASAANPVQNRVTLKRLGSGTGSADLTPPKKISLAKKASKASTPVQNTAVQQKQGSAVTIMRTVCITAGGKSQQAANIAQKVELDTDSSYEAQLAEQKRRREEILKMKERNRLQRLSANQKASGAGSAGVTAVGGASQVQQEQGAETGRPIASLASARDSKATPRVSSVLRGTQGSNTDAGTASGFSPNKLIGQKRKQVADEQQRSNVLAAVQSANTGAQQEQSSYQNLPPKRMVLMKNETAGTSATTGAQPPTQRVRVRISNLTPATTAEHICKMARHCGQITRCQIAKNKRSALVSFKTEDQATFFVNSYDCTRHRERILKVQID